MSWFTHNWIYTILIVVGAVSLLTGLAIALVIRELRREDRYFASQHDAELWKHHDREPGA